MLKLGTIAFGGPAVHVAVLRDETVRRRSWLDDREFLDLFGAVSVLPGPSSTQLASTWAMPQTGKRFEVRGLQVGRCEDGLMVGRWGYTDIHGMLQQLGLIA